MVKIKKLSLSKKQVAGLAPNCVANPAKIYENWTKSALRWGVSANVEPFEKCAEIRLPSLANSVFLPEFLRAGSLQLKTPGGSKAHRKVGKFLAENDFPALLQLKKKSAFLHFSEFDSNEMVRLMERNFLQLAATLDSSVVKCTMIDLENFGGTFSLLGSSVPEAEILTSRSEVDEFFRKLPGEFRQRSQARGFEFDYVSDYNRENRDSLVPFHFIFISSFEADLDDSQREALWKFITRSNAAKAGIYFFLLLHTKEAFNGLSPLEDTASLFEKAGTQGERRIEVIDTGGLETGDGKAHTDYELRTDPLDNQALKRLSAFCLAHLSKRKLEPVKIALPDANDWPGDAWTKNSAEGLDVPIGKSRGETLFFRLGCGEIVHNALVGGAVGTGKTNLLHAILMQALAHYSPGELCVSILDYKSGTEFGIYDGCPHLYALSLGSATKFGLDLLEHFQAEMEARAELFKKEGVSNLKEFRQKSGVPMPRHLVVIDEFQVLLGEKRNGASAQAALEDLIRRSRSFGFNFVLSSQTLRDGALSGAALSNIGCRVCLRLSERDCSDFLTVGNDLPSKFEYPGQAVFNNSEGRIEGNLEFRTAFYTSAEIDRFLTLLAEQATVDPHVTKRKPFIYDGAGPVFKKDLQRSTKSRHILIAVEDGIPQKPLYADLDPETGPLVAVGTGPLREMFEKNLEDELSAITPGKIRRINGEEIETFCEEWLTNPGILEGLELVVIRPRPRDGTNFNLQNLLSTSRLNATVKIVLVADNTALLRNFCVDRSVAEFFVCLDQRSYSDIGWDGLLTGQPLAAAVFVPGENDAKLVKIPQI
jgi:hypothetical protein